MRDLLLMAFFAMFICFPADAQIKKYWIELKDKAGNQFSIEEPEEFLSARSIERRKRQGIKIIEEDLPVSNSYLKEIKANGAKVLYTSKWFNAIAVQSDEESLKKLERLDFIKSINLIAIQKEKKWMAAKSGSQEFETTGSDLGFGKRQMELLNGSFLHEKGYKGQGITVAVLDGGFIGIEKNVFFDSLRSKGLILSSKDFVDGDDFVQHASTHGSKVLSVMAANQPGILVGMAPSSSYVCIRTEDRNLEMRIEECNWIAGAEYADSLGVDIINTSLGYSDFNLPSMNYDFEDMDGKTSLVTQAADKAFLKGILVVTSAGNNGRFDDGHIDAPGDARYILTVGATDLYGNPANFSSFGPTADGRVKPEIVAPGVHITVASAISTKVHTASGTSYSSPLIAGLAAALWSAFPDKSNMEIRKAIIKSATHPTDMNNKTGAGLPDFKKAYEILKYNRL